MVGEDGTKSVKSGFPLPRSAVSVFMRCSRPFLSRTSRSPLLGKTHTWGRPTDSRMLRARRAR